MEMSHRSADEDRLLVEVAEASRLHWRYVGGPLESARAAWLLSRVLVLVGRETDALVEAEHSLAIARKEGLGPFDEAFAHEAIARAQAAMANMTASATARAAGESVAVQIASDDDREWVRRNLASITSVPPT